MTIERLDVQPSSQWDFPSAVLLQATTSGTSIVTLELSDREHIHSLEIFVKLEAFLQRTSTLQHLRLNHYHFTKEKSECLFLGLTNHFTRPTASLHKLSLAGCEFFDGARNSLIELMQMPNSAAQFTGDKNCSFLRELCMGKTTVAVVENEEPYTSKGRFLAQIFRQLPVNSECPDNSLPNGLLATHSSQLLKLSVHYQELPSFVDEVVASTNDNKSIVRLPSLTVSDIDEYECSRTDEEYKTFYDALNDRLYR